MISWKLKENLPSSKEKASKAKMYIKFNIETKQQKRFSFSKENWSRYSNLEGKVLHPHETTSHQGRRYPQSKAWYQSSLVSKYQRLIYCSW